MIFCLQKVIVDLQKICILFNVPAATRNQMTEGRRQRTRLRSPSCAAARRSQSQRTDDRSQMTEVR